MEAGGRVGIYIYIFANVAIRSSRQKKKPGNLEDVLKRPDRKEGSINFDRLSYGFMELWLWRFLLSKVPDLDIYIERDMIRTQNAASHQN